MVDYKGIAGFLEVCRVAYSVNGEGVFDSAGARGFTRDCGFKCYFDGDGVRDSGSRVFGMQGWSFGGEGGG